MHSKNFPMSEFMGMQRYWGKLLSQPWLNNQAVGSTEVARDELVKLLAQSVNMQADGRGGECISALLIGENGVGKSYVIRTAIESLKIQGQQVIPITIHGSICTDDRSSMRQIFSQFQRSLVGGSTLDTVTRATFQQGTLSEWCGRLAALLQECTRSDHMVIITLEDFDAFCHSKAKQSLLYNLFDLMHLKDTRFVVIGVTTRPDATELLEKRIKSRFQLRKIVLSPPGTFQDLLNVMEAILLDSARPETGRNVDAVSGKKKNKKNAKDRAETTLNARIKDILGSKDLLHNWSLYMDLGFSIREFATAALTSLSQCQDDGELEGALVQCMHAMTRTMYGDMAVVQTIIPALTLRDHIVLVGLLKLHQDGKRPKCFAHILKEIGSFQKSSHMTSACIHSNRAYWHSFQGLVRCGLIEMIDSPTSSSAPPPMFCRCRLSIGQTYAALFRDTDSEKTKKGIIPHEVYQWANRERNMHIES